MAHMLAFLLKDSLCQHTCSRGHHTPCVKTTCAGRQLGAAASRNQSHSYRHAGQFDLWCYAAALRSIDTRYEIYPCPKYIPDSDALMVHVPISTSMPSLRVLSWRPNPKISILRLKAVASSHGPAECVPLSRPSSSKHPCASYANDG
jgi:hypothetical protein